MSDFVTERGSFYYQNFTILRLRNLIGLLNALPDIDFSRLDHNKLVIKPTPRYIKNRNESVIGPPNKSCFPEILNLSFYRAVPTTVQLRYLFFLGMLAPVSSDLENFSNSIKIMK